MVREGVSVTMGDRYQYYIDECEKDSSCNTEDRVELLRLLEIEPGDAFLVFLISFHQQQESMIMQISSTENTQRVARLY